MRRSTAEGGAPAKAAAPVGQAPVAARRRFPARAWLALALVAAFGLYAPALGNGYAFDDRYTAMAVRDDGHENRLVASLQPITSYFAANYWDGVYPADVLYRPVTTLSVALLHAGFGRHAATEPGQALPQHLANVLLHVLATWLAYRLARRLGLQRPGSGIAALAFAVHAIHSEVVAGVVGRSELLAFVGGAGSVLLATGRVAPLRLAAAGLLAFLAFASKESAVAWTGVLALFLLREGVPARDPGEGSERRPGWRPRLRRALGRTALVAGPGLALFLLLRAHMIASLPPGPPAPAADGLAVRLTGTTGWAHGLATSLLPVHLACDHGPAVFTPVRSPFDGRFLAAAAAIAAVALGVAAAWRRAPALALGGAFFLLTSVLVSNVPFPIGVPFAERLYYTPSLGVCLVAGALADRLRPPWRRVAAPAFALWLAWSAVMVLRRNPLWQDDATLFAHEYHNQPRSARIAINWAGVLRKAGRDAEVVPVLERVVALDPQMAAAWNELGVLAMQAGRPAAAVEHFAACLRAQRQDSDVHTVALTNIVRVHLAQKDPRAAIAAVEDFAEVEPATVARAFTTLQDLLGTEVSAAWAVAISQKLERAAPLAVADWDRRRGLACYRRKAFGEAVAFLRAFLPRAADARDRQQLTLLLASALFETGDRDAARSAVTGLLAEPDLTEPIARAARDLRQRLDAPR